MTNSLETRTSFNAGNYPVVDCNGKPFTPGCRIRFVIPTYYINTAAGTGTLTRIDQYGGCYIVSDEPLSVYDRNGFVREKRREQYTPMADYQIEGPHEGKRVTAKGIGDRHEHGLTKTFIEVIDEN